MIGTPTKYFEEEFQSIKDNDEYYESRHVGTKARSDKTCAYCGENIPKGTPHYMHHFYPKFYACPTHLECAEPFEDFFKK